MTITNIPNSKRRVSTDVAMTEIKSAIQTVLSSTQSSGTTAEAQMTSFLQSIEPNIDQALADADVMSLGYLRDRLILQAGRVSLGAIYQQKVIVANTVVTVVGILIKVGIGSIAAA